MEIESSQEFVVRFPGEFGDTFVVRDQVNVEFSWVVGCVSRSDVLCTREQPGNQGARWRDIDLTVNLPLCLGP